MSSIILQAETLNLPTHFATKLFGKKVELIEHGNSIIISPVECPIEAMHGMFESDGHEVDRFMQRKSIEKELENVG